MGLGGLLSAVVYLIYVDTFKLKYLLTFINL